jgi:hypothetical protein
MRQLEVFRWVNAHQTRFLHRKVQASLSKLISHVTRRVFHGVSVHWHFIGASKSARRPLNDAIRRAAAAVWRDGDLIVVCVEGGFLAGYESLAVPKKLLV